MCPDLIMYLQQEVPTRNRFLPTRPVGTLTPVSYPSPLGLGSHVVIVSDSECGIGFARGWFVRVADHCGMAFNI